MTDQAKLLALSDLLVLTALERAWARTRRRQAGSPANNCAAAARHVQYMKQPVPHDLLDRALRESWALAALLIERHDLDVDVDAWTQLLDSYTRTLLMMGQKHDLATLSVYLRQLPALVEFDAWAEVDAV